MRTRLRRLAAASLSLALVVVLALASDALASYGKSSTSSYGTGSTRHAHTWGTGSRPHARLVVATRVADTGFPLCRSHNYGSRANPRVYQVSSPDAACSVVRLIVKQAGPRSAAPGSIYLPPNPAFTPVSSTISATSAGVPGNRWTGVFTQVSTGRTVTVIGEYVASVRPASAG